MKEFYIYYTFVLSTRLGFMDKICQTKFQNPQKCKGKAITNFIHKLLGVFNNHIYTISETVTNIVSFCHNLCAHMLI